MAPFGTSPESVPKNAVMVTANETKAISYIFQKLSQSQVIVHMHILRNKICTNLHDFVLIKNIYIL